MTIPDSSQKATFINYLYEPIAKAIQEWDDAMAKDIYAIWLQLSLTDDDIRYVAIHSIGYSTNSHTTPELARSYGSRWSPYCQAGETILNLCHPSQAEYAEIYGIPDRHDAHGIRLREAYLDGALTRFNRSDEELSEVREHAKLQAKRNENSATLNTEDMARLESLTRKYKLSEAEQEALRSHDSLLSGLYQEAILGAFLEACGEVIRQLHREGVIECKCGRPVAVGLAFSNDVDSRVGLETVRESNPLGLAREIEEQMMGTTYAQLEAEAVLHRELTMLPFDAQADFWAELLIAAEDPNAQAQGNVRKRLHELGLEGFGAVWRRAARQSEVAARVVARLIPTIEQGARPEILPYGSDDPVLKNAELAASLLDALIHIGRYPDNRETVAENDVERLHAVLVRLFRESESLESVGHTTFLVARALHAFRPQRFPREKFGGGGSTANRLLNYREFGLAKADSTTPDYDEAADEARRAARRQARLM